LNMVQTLSPGPITDQQDLARFGYRQELQRSLGSFSSFAAGFSYISILTGMFQTFHMGFAAGGPAFFWTWPVVFIGQLLVALCFAELAAHYPLSGSVYQWSRQIGHRAVGWLAGWIFLACLIVTLAAVALALQVTLPQIHSCFQIVGSGSDPADRAKNAVLLGSLLIAFSTAINAASLKLVARINNLGVCSELVGLAALIVLLGLHAVRGPEVLLDTQGKGACHEGGYLAPFLTAMTLTASYVLYGFDTAGTLAEETHQPRNKAPQAILRALSAAAVLGGLLLIVALSCAGDLADPRLARPDGGLPFLVTQTLGKGPGAIFLIAVIFAIVVCSLAVQTSVVRLVFAMARDNQLPFSRPLARVSPQARQPTRPNLVIGLLAIGILLANINFARVIEAVTALAALWANLAYLLLVSSLLVERLRGWPARGAKSAEPGVSKARLFSLGRWGTVINLLAVCWGVFTVINIAWPRAEGAESSAAYAPLLCTAGLMLSGMAYYGLWQRRKNRAAELKHPAPSELISFGK
jgi:urea carboxylase system permease